MQISLNHLGNVIYDIAPPPPPYKFLIVIWSIKQAFENLLTSELGILRAKILLEKGIQLVHV